MVRCLFVIADGPWLYVFLKIGPCVVDPFLEGDEPASYLAPLGPRPPVHAAGGFRGGSCETATRADLSSEVRFESSVACSVARVHIIRAHR